MNSYLGIALTVGGVSGLMVGTAAVRKRVAIHAETARKIVHVGSGLLALSLPWLFTTWWPVVIACGVSAIGLAVLRHTNWFPVRLREVIGSVDRESGGEFYFPLAIAMLFLLAGADPLLYCIPVLILTFADTAAAVVGLRFGCTHYRSTRGHKSVEGSLAFFVVSDWLRQSTNRRGRGRRKHVNRGHCHRWIGQFVVAADRVGIAGHLVSRFRVWPLASDRIDCAPRHGHCHAAAARTRARAKKFL